MRKSAWKDFFELALDLLTERMVDLFVVRIIYLLTDALVDLFVFQSTNLMRSLCVSLVFTVM